MKKKIWQQQQPLDLLIEKYTSGDDLLLDQFLIAHDIYGSLAHSAMLQKQGLITKKDFKNLQKNLSEIFELYKKGKYQLEFGDEDVHTKIEQDLTARNQESGTKLHTGRSRNDQVLLDMRLFSKEKILALAKSIVNLSELFISQAKKYELTAMPGMTHMQPAMLSSVGLWLGQFSESLLDDLAILENSYYLNDQSPLGSGAAYGVSLPIDRGYSAKLLGFAKVQNNTLYCQNSRGKIEGQIVSACVQIMGTLSRFASDSLLFSTEPFSFISFEKSLGTGSSIMPQKNNWDALELLRARYAKVLAFQFQINSITSNLPSGYNRDLQEIKEPLIKSLQITQDSLAIAELFLENLEVNKQQMLAHIPKELFATYWTYELMKEKSLSFRDAYHFVKENIDQIPDFDIEQVLSESNSQGAPGNLGLRQIKKKLAEKKQQWKIKEQDYQLKIQNLFKEIK